MSQELNPFERWMVAQNVEHAAEYGEDTVVANLRANGYPRVADAVEQVLRERSAT